MPEEPATAYASIPMQWTGPIRLHLDGVDEEVEVPLATYESPLWPSVKRGARVSVKSGGIRAVVVDECMTRSILVEAPDALTAAEAAAAIRLRQEELAAEASSTSRFAQLVAIHTQQIGRQLFLRFAFTTGDAAGHNMVTKASDHLMQWVLKQYPELRYVSVSGNFCTDKKVSAVNGILGRGRNVVAELRVPESICTRYLKATPRELADINVKKNYLGSIAAGSLRSANAHFANMLLAFYLATGQDAANIVEGSQGFVTAEVENEGLYFSVTLPHLIVGSTGSGKGLDFVRENLDRLGCTADREPGENARRLALLCAATVLCGELSLLAALTNPGELMAAHLAMERT